MVLFHTFLLKKQMFISFQQNKTDIKSKHLQEEEEDFKKKAHTVSKWYLFAELYLAWVV